MKTKVIYTKITEEIETWIPTKIPKAYCGAVNIALSTCDKSVIKK